MESNPMVGEVESWQHRLGYLVGRGISSGEEHREGDPQDKGHLGTLWNFVSAESEKIGRCFDMRGFP